jgi:hypothetical protein
VTFSGWFCGELALARAKGWEIAPNALVAFLGREILALSAWLRSWTTNRVIWANGHFNVFTGLRTRAPASAPASPARSTLALRRQSVKSG